MTIMSPLVSNNNVWIMSPVYADYGTANSIYKKIKKKDTDTVVVRILFQSMALLSQWYINRQSVNTRSILYSWNMIFNKGTFQMSEVDTLRYIYNMKRKLTQWWSTIPPIIYCLSNINKANNHLSLQIIEHKNDHDLWHWKSRYWFWTDTKMWQG